MTKSVTFTLSCCAEPGMLSRCLAPFAKRDLVPDIVQSRREGDMLHVVLAMHAMPAEEVHLVEGNLRQVIGVVSVRRADGLRVAA